MRRLAVAAALLTVLAGPVLAVQPDEVLPDAAMEARARSISRLLRCPVCQGETIDDSNADISRDLRLYVRERLVAGDRDAQVIDAVTARYGDYVLFQPRAAGRNWILWLAGPAMALAGLVGAFAYTRRRAPAGSPPPLSAEEQARLDAIMEGERGG